MSLDLEVIQARWELWLGYANWVHGQHLAAAAREDVPALLAHCRAQAAEIERLREEVERLQPFEALCGAYARDAKRQAEEAWRIG